MLTAPFRIWKALVFSWFCNTKCHIKCRGLFKSSQCSWFLMACLFWSICNICGVACTIYIESFNPLYMIQATGIVLTKFLPNLVSESAVQIDVLHQVRIIVMNITLILHIRDTHGKSVRTANSILVILKTNSFNWRDFELQSCLTSVLCVWDELRIVAKSVKQHIQSLPKNVCFNVEHLLVSPF